MYNLVEIRMNKDISKNIILIMYRYKTCHKHMSNILIKYNNVNRNKNDPYNM